MGLHEPRQERASAKSITPPLTVRRSEEFPQNFTELSRPGSAVCAATTRTSERQQSCWGDRCRSWRKTHEDRRRCTDRVCRRDRIGAPGRRLQPGHLLGTPESQSAIAHGLHEKPAPERWVPAPLAKRRAAPFFDGSNASGNAKGAAGRRTVTGDSSVKFHRTFMTGVGWRPKDSLTGTLTCLYCGDSDAFPPPAPFDRQGCLAMAARYRGALRRIAAFQTPLGNRWTGRRLHRGARRLLRGNGHVRAALPPVERRAGETRAVACQLAARCPCGVRSHRAP
jgi:hypothetical protein